MKLIALSLFLLSASCMQAQEKVQPSDNFTIDGKVTHSRIVTSRAADSLATADLGEISTVNHRGEVRSVRKNVKGILLRDFLKNMLPDADKPKEMGSYYFILTGTDGSRFVVSFNEAFSGDTIYIITESDGHNWASIPDRVAVLSLMQPHRGHIAMKGLAHITVQKVQ